METTIIKTEDFPFEQFKLLGLEKKDVLSLPAQTLKALQTGNRSALIQFHGYKVHENAEPITLNGKLSIALDNAGKAKLKLHPVNVVPKNNLGLNEIEIKYLQQDQHNLIPKLVTDKKGNIHESFIGLDPLTNEYVSIDRTKLIGPEKINGVPLTVEQKSDFINGKPVKIGENNFRLDVNSETGISEKNLVSIEFKKGTYSVNNALLDAALIASGAAPLVILEHLAKSLIRNVYGNTKKNAAVIKDLLSTDLRPAMTKTLATIIPKEADKTGLSKNEKENILLANIAQSLDDRKLSRHQELEKSSFLDRVYAKIDTAINNSDLNATAKTAIKEDLKRMVEKDIATLNPGKDSESKSNIIEHINLVIDHFEMNSADKIRLKDVFSNLDITVEQLKADLQSRGSDIALSVEKSDLIKNTFNR